ncbi:hypothetical protein ACOME3_006595 [Neoechinorhynchus agilis]
MKFNRFDSRLFRESKMRRYSVPWSKSQSGRLKQDYGAKVNFKKKKVNVDASFTGLPQYARTITNRLRERCIEFKDFQAVELCNLEYTKNRGSHIEPHLDDQWLWGPRIAIINLVSQCYFKVVVLALGEYIFLV